MFDHSLTKETGLERLGTPDRSVKFEIPTWGPLFLNIHTYNALLDAAARLDLLDDKFGQVVSEHPLTVAARRTNQAFRQVLRSLVIEHVDPPLSGLDDSIDHLYDRQSFLEVLWNALEHSVVVKTFSPENGTDEGVPITVCETFPVTVEAFTRANTGVLWVVEQSGGPVVDIQKLLTVYLNTAAIGENYYNHVGRMRGCGLKRLRRTPYELASFQVFSNNRVRSVLFQKFLAKNAHLRGEPWMGLYEPWMG